MVQQLAPSEALGVVYTIAPSTRSPGLIWAGTDDGQIYVTRDDGANWENVTPAALSAWSKVSMLEASPHDGRRRMRRSIVTGSTTTRRTSWQRTTTVSTWTEIASAIPAGTFVRAVREDPVRKGLLFAGTEFGVYVSGDTGQHWESLQLNLPRAPIHDLVVHDNDLIVATHGRSFWVLDDLSPLRQVDGSDRRERRAPAETVDRDPDPPQREHGHTAPARDAHGTEPSRRRGHRLPP